MTKENIVRIVGLEEDTSASSARTINLDHFVTANEFPVNGVSRLRIVMTGGVEHEFIGLTLRDWDGFVFNRDGEAIRTLRPTTALDQ